MVNTAAKHVVADYLKTPEPRYALLVEGAWGSGKTEFVRRETGWDTSPGVLYLSLFGLDSAEAFHDALLAAMLSSPGQMTKKKALSLGERIKNVVSNSQIAGFSINLSSLSLLEGLRSDLPRTLVFDDLERVAMQPTVMSGLLNQLIEHDRRHVILIANTDEMVKGDDDGFDMTAEKLIGRRIAIKPDIEAALQSYWVSIPEGRGKSYLRAHQDLATTIFRQGGHGNLRLLRSALQAAAGLLDRIDEDLFAFEAALQRLTGTFLALHMAYSRGALGKTELEKRGDRYAFGNKYGQPKPDLMFQSLIDLAEAHPDCDIDGTFRPVLPVTLATMLLIDGYASRETINSTLRSLHHFQSEGTPPDWIKLWNWVESPTDQTEAVLSRIEDRLSRNKITSPGELIQVYGAMDILAQYGGIALSREDLVEKFGRHIEDLETANLLPPRNPSFGDDYAYGFELRQNTFLFGDVSFDLDATAERVVAALRDAMDKTLEAALPAEAHRLGDLFGADPTAFLADLAPEGSEPRFDRWPILHHLDAERFATGLFDLMRRDPEIARNVTKELKRRSTSERTQPEHDWIRQVRASLERSLNSLSRLEAARLRLFIQRSM